jgi:serine phosphatase RsbU (regulator of sigma subunit)/PAS domain-containing protein
MVENMPQDDSPAGPLGELTARRDALRHALATPGGEPGALLDAALTELDAAIDALTERSGGFGHEEAGAAPDTGQAERRLLRAVFQHAPFPLFLLERDGTVRRANEMAGELIGASPGYATGKPLTAFADPPSRAAVRTHLAAAARTGKPRRAACRLLGPDGPADVTLAIRVLELPGDPRLLIAGVTAGQAPAPPERDARGAQRAPARAVRSMVQRMDMITAVTRLLLDNSTFSEALTVQRCARLLAGEIASWVIVDVERDGGLGRQFATGPRDEDAERLARTIRAADPGPGTVCWQVHATGKSVLLAHAEDESVLGADAGGTPLLMLLGVTSVLSVPISDGSTAYGALTLARVASEGYFDVADLALAEELAGHLAIAIGVDRMFRRRTEVAQALQASLLPARLPSVPGLDFAAAYIAATDWQDISGDFYDIFPSKGEDDGSDGWGIVVGDVCGKGEEAAAITAAARHAVRAIAHANPHPADVLRQVNSVLLAGGFEERFVTTSLAYLRQDDGKVRVLLAGAGHPGPGLVRADGRVEVLECGGMPLGLFDSAEPGTSELVLAPGDLLFFYTDGVTDARGIDMSLFQDRLADQLASMAGQSAAETVRAVQELVTEFSGGELRDDMTMLAVKVASSPA